MTEEVMNGHRLIGKLSRFQKSDVNPAYHQCLTSWRCSSCTGILEDDGSIWCDPCLNWMHMKYAELKKSTRTRFMVCSNCK